MIEAQKNSNKALLFIFIMAAAIILVIQAAHSSSKEMEGMKNFIPNLKVEVDSSERLGNEYLGKEAHEGFSFYRLNLTVRNIGRADADSPYDYQLSFYEKNDANVLGADQDDRIDYDNPFSEGSQPSIPSGMTVKTWQVIQVADGVKEITGTLANRLTDKKERIKIQLD